MKRILTLCLLMAMLCVIPVMGQAMDQEEWDLTCLYTSSGGTVYDLTVEETTNDSASSTDIGYTCIFTPVGSLASGSAVKPTGEKEDGKVEVAYYDGGVRYGYMEAGSYASAYITVTAGGKTYKIPSRATQSDALLRKSIALRYSGADVEAVLEAYYGGDSGDDGDEDSSADDSVSSNGGSGSSSKAAASDRMNPVFRLIDENGEENMVTLVTLGLVDSEVKLNGEVTTVRTADLTWDHDVDDENKLLAVINAKRTGQVTMHAKSKAKSTVLKKIDTNRIVLVLRIGKSYTRILCDGVEGFVLTDALDFYPVGGVKEEDAPTPVPGWVSYKGKVNSKQSVNIRQSGQNGSRIIEEIRAGTPVWVFQQEGKWSEIEVDGYRAFILSEYITLDDTFEAETAEPESTEKE